MDKPLHVRVAEALGWTYLGESEFGWEGEPPSDLHPKANIRRRLDQHIGVDRYDTDWSATGPLIEKYKLTLQWSMCTKHEDCVPCWEASDEVYLAIGESPLLAVCGLILGVREVGKL